VILNAVMEEARSKDDTDLDPNNHPAPVHNNELYSYQRKIVYSSSPLSTFDIHDPVDLGYRFGDVVTRFEGLKVVQSLLFCALLCFDRLIRVFSSSEA
jgi:hypothetical protein